MRRGIDLRNKKIAEGYQVEKILTSPRPVFDFIPEIRNSSQLDQGVKKSWEKFFRQKKVPYVLTEKEPGILTMWKFVEVKYDSMVQDH